MRAPHSGVRTVAATVEHLAPLVTHTFEGANRPRLMQHARRVRAERTSGNLAVGSEAVELARGRRNRRDDVDERVIADPVAEMMKGIGDDRIGDGRVLATQDGLCECLSVSRAASDKV